MSNSAHHPHPIAPVTIIGRLSAVLGLGFVVMLGRPQSVAAQGGAHFEALSTPPSNAGTCQPAAPLKGFDSVFVRGSRLVMKSLTPGLSRELTLWLDRQGGFASYSEYTSAFDGKRTGRSSMVSAVLDRLGVMSGSRIDITVTVPDSLPNDVEATLRSIRERSRGEHSTRPLDVEEARRVRELAAFLRKRCPL